MVTTLSPNVRATPTRPMPTCGKVAAITALPHPANVSQNVPINSAAYFLASMGASRIGLLPPGAKIRLKSSKFPNADRSQTEFHRLFRGPIGPKFGSNGGHLAFCLVHPRAQDLGHGLRRPWS